MIRKLTLVTTLLALSIAGASAQRRQAFPPIPAHTIPAGISATELQKKLQGMLRAAHTTTDAMFKTTAGGERVIAQAAYDFSTVPGGQLEDSVFLKYLGNRTSTFDFDYLQYDFGNASDAPGVFSGTSYVHFDTGRGYDQSGPAGSAIRTYNASGKVVRSEYEDDVAILFTYDVQGKLIRSLVMGYNTTSGTFTDSNSRNFYSYNAAGHVLADSSQRWNRTTSVWEPDMTIRYTPNAAGKPVQALFTSYFSPVPSAFMQYNFVYNAANLPVLITIKSDDGSGNLVDSYKDSLGYSANMRVWNRSYGFNMVTSAWDLSYEEKRRLNAASLPDSVWSREIYNGGANIDTTIQKLAYNAKDNPVSLRYFAGRSLTPDYVIRWHYQNQSGVGVNGVTVKKDLSIYPNPASDILYLKGVTEGHYLIQNMAGQILQSGTLQPAAGLPVSTLAPGVYSLSLQEKNGVIHTTQFVRQ